MSIRLNPLSVAKGHKHSCELCSKTATLLCSACRVTYYCSSGHLRTDRAGIHAKICSLLGALRSLRPTLGSEEERQKRQLTIAMSHHALIDLCQHEARKWSIKARHDLAIPGALQALRFSLEVYGQNRIELVPSYLLLAEGNLGLGRLKAAEEFLLYANWAVLQSTTAPSHSTQSLLHRQFGHLYSKQERWEQARASYAKDIYHAALEYGPEHIETSIGLYHMGAAFLSSTPRPNMEAALAFFDKVVDSFYRFLLHLRSHSNEAITDYLLDHQIAASSSHLLHILTTRHRHLGPRHIATAEAAYVLGLLKVAGGWDVDGEFLLGRAELVYEEVLGKDNESTKGIRRAREEMGEVRMQRGERMKDWEVEADNGGQPQSTQSGADDEAKGPPQEVNEPQTSTPSADLAAAVPENPSSRASSPAKGEVEVVGDIAEPATPQKAQQSTESSIAPTATIADAPSISAAVEQPSVPLALEQSREPSPEAPPGNPLSQAAVEGEASIASHVADRVEEGQAVASTFEVGTAGARDVDAPEPAKGVDESKEQASEAASEAASTDASAEPSVVRDVGDVSHRSDSRPRSQSHSTVSLSSIQASAEE